MSTKNFGTIYKESQQFIDIRNELVTLLKLSRIPVKDIIVRSGISDTHYYRLLERPELLKGKHITSLMRGIIEYQNYQLAKK